MILPFPNESRFEATTVERLERLGYEHDDGKTLRENPDFPLDSVVQTDALRRHLQQIAPMIFGVPVTVPAQAEYAAVGVARQAARRSAR